MDVSGRSLLTSIPPMENANDCFAISDMTALLGAPGNHRWRSTISPASLASSQHSAQSARR
jgi:hypothetical protein